MQPCFEAWEQIGAGVRGKQSWLNLTRHSDKVINSQLYIQCKFMIMYWCHTVIIIYGSTKVAITLGPRQQRSMNSTLRFDRGLTLAVCPSASRFDWFGIFLSVRMRSVEQHSSSYVCVCLLDCAFWSDGAAMLASGGLREGSKTHLLKESEEKEGERKKEIKKERYRCKCINIHAHCMITFVSHKTLRTRHMSDRIILLF